MVNLKSQQVDTWNEVVASPKMFALHSIICGMSDSGKSRLALALAITLAARRLQDPHARGWVYFDPHGPDADLLRKWLAVMRDTQPGGQQLDELVVVIDVGKTDWVKYNLLECRYGETPSKRANNLANTILSVWQEDRTVVNRMLRVLRQTFEALILAKRTLGDAIEFLQDQNVRKQVLAESKNERLAQEVAGELGNDSLESYWDKHFKNLPRDVAESSLNRLERLVKHDDLRPMLNTHVSTIDPLEMMNSGKLVIIKAPMNDLRLGEDGAYLFGALTVAEFHRAALSREGTDENTWRPFTFFAEEFPNYATQTAVKVMKNDRKYKLSFVLISQQVVSRQATEEVMRDVLANANTLIVGKVDEDDAEILARRMITLDLYRVKHMRERWQKRPGFQIPLGPLVYQWGEVYERFEDPEFFSTDQLKILAVHELTHVPKQQFYFRRRNVDEDARIIRAPNVADLPNTPEMLQALARQLEAAKRLCLPRDLPMPTASPPPVEPRPQMESVPELPLWLPYPFPAPKKRPIHAA